MTDKFPSQNRTDNLRLATGPPTPQYGSDVMAQAVIHGVEYNARIEQFRRAAYVSVWGGGQDFDASVQSMDVSLEIAQAARGSSALHPDKVAVLQMVAAVFALHSIQSMREAQKQAI